MSSGYLSKYQPRNSTFTCNICIIPVVFSPNPNQNVTVCNTSPLWTYRASCRRASLQPHRWSAGTCCPQTSRCEWWNWRICCTPRFFCISGPRRRCPRGRHWSPRPGRSRQGRTSSHGSPPCGPWCEPPPSCPCKGDKGNCKASHWQPTDEKRNFYIVIFKINFFFCG